jgi:molecular chaperone GrpE (heat shock protein)
MTTKTMDKVLANFEVVEMNPTGEKFDPNEHDAIFMIPTHDTIEHNHIAQVV